MSSKKILWIAPIINPAELLNHVHISAAANKWQISFIEGLKKNNYQVEIGTFLTQRSWPYGNVISKFVSDLLPNYNSKGINYINFPIIRDLCISLNFFILFYRNDYNYLITYNNNLYNKLFGVLLKLFNKRINWISIIADNDDFSLPNCTIYLSASAYEKSHIKSKIIFEGGLPIFKGSKNLGDNMYSKKILLYSGDFSELAGILRFVSMFLSLKQNLFELHIYGRGNDSQIKEICDNTPNVKYFGFVDVQTLQTRMNSAFAFVNPRNEFLDEKLNTFPSKLLDYISFGKPIISTKLNSVTKKYNPFLFFYSSNDIKSLEKVLNELSKMPTEAYDKINLYSSEFCKKNTWDIAVNEIMIKLENANN